MPISPAPILEHLHLTQEAASLSFLNRILAAWSARIPWESASRIARHRTPGTPQTYARFPETFFASALKHGTGGTCFESNLALRALLTPLGFSSTLHFCDMQTATINPHCALIVHLENQDYLADVGYPVPSALRLGRNASTTVHTPVYQFTAIPVAESRWEIVRKAGDYEGQSFVIKTEPVDEGTFRARLLRDHELDGLFLKEVILSRTDSTNMLRYSEEKGLVKRTHYGEETVLLSAQEQRNLPATLAHLFNFDETILRTALAHQGR